MPPAAGAASFAAYPSHAIPFGVMLNAMPGDFNREPEAPDTPCGCTNCYRLFSYADIA